MTPSTVFVQPAPPEVGGPAAPGKVQITTTGGRLPSWRRDGQGLYYLSAKNEFVTVPIDTTGGSFKPLAAQVLFKLPAADVTSYDVTADGKRILLNVPAEDVSDMPVTVVSNSMRLLKK